MKLVVDANVLFASLIKEGKTRDILINSNFEFYAPLMVIEEFIEHIDEIALKSRVEKRYLRSKVKELLKASSLKVVDWEEFEDFKEKALKISPDIDDFHYFALALKLNCPIWSNDLELKQQSKVKIYSTKELIKTYNIKIK